MMHKRFFGPCIGAASGIPGRVESLCWLLALNVTGGHFPVKKSGVTSVISRDQKRSNASVFLACCLVDVFFDECYSFSDFLSKLCRALRGRLVRKGSKSCLGQEMKADIRSSASFLKPRAPGLSCTRSTATCLLMMHKRFFGSCTCAGTESLYRSQYSHRDDPL